LPSNGLRVLAIEAKPLDGCGQSIEKPPTDFNSTIKNFVVVMQRMNCSFEEKVRNAQNAGFAAAIVHNVGSNDLGKEEGIEVFFFRQL
jgi:E3 ubiquitin-protein ligase RNF13